MESSDIYTQKHWTFWYYEWANHDFPGEDSIYFKGPWMEISFIQTNNQLDPGVTAGYITVEGNPPGDVTIRFKPQKIIKHMRKYLPMEILYNHWVPMEEAGWVWSQPEWS